MKYLVHTYQHISSFLWFFIPFEFNCQVLTQRSIIEAISIASVAFPSEALQLCFGFHILFVLFCVTMFSFLSTLFSLGPLCAPTENYCLIFCITECQNNHILYKVKVKSNAFGYYWSLFYVVLSHNCPRLGEVWVHAHMCNPATHFLCLFQARNM